MYGGFDAVFYFMRRKTEYIYKITGNKNKDHFMMHVPILKDKKFPAIIKCRSARDFHHFCISRCAKLDLHIHFIAIGHLCFKTDTVISL